MWLETIKDLYGENLVELEPSRLYRVLRFDENRKPFQVMYIDSTDRWIGEEYSENLERVVQDDYFNSAGSIQWNYYYYYVTDSDRLEQNKAQKVAVEANSSYARKFVMTEADFVAWIREFENVSQDANSEITTDLFSIWIGKLREQRLYFVFNEKDYPNYKQPVEDFINGLESKDIDDWALTSTLRATGDCLDRVGSLSLINFREYPLEKEYQFGKVNLVYGPNATGKTSFFDAIELLITGSCDRGGSNGFKINAKDCAGRELTFPCASNVYKERDKHWYKSAITRGNNLNGNFNRFNYYSSDAAFNLKLVSDNRQVNIEEIFADIALGREVNRLEERISEFKKRFEVQKDALATEEGHLRLALTDKNSQLQAYAANLSARNNYKDSLLSTLNEQKWKAELDGYLSQVPTNLDSDLHRVNLLLDAMRSLNFDESWISKRNIGIQLKIEKDRLEKAELLFKTLEDIKKDLSEKDLSLRSLKSVAHLFSEYVQISKHPFFKYLIGLTDNIGKKKALFQKYSKIQNEISLTEIEDLKKLFTGAISIAKIEESINGECRDLELEVESSQNKILQFERNLDELARTLSNLRSSGLAYLNANIKTTLCPLCNTQFESNESLINAINKSVNEISGSALLLVEKEKHLEGERKLRISRQVGAIFSKLKVASLLLFDEDWESKGIDEVKEAFLQNESKLQNVSNVLLELNTAQAELTLSAIDESKLIELRSALKSTLDFDSLDPYEIEQRFTSYKNNISLFEEEYSFIKTKSAEVEAEYHSIIGDSIERHTNIQERVNLILRLAHYISQLEDFLDFSDNETLLDIGNKVALVNGAFETFKNERDKENDVSFAHKMLREEVDQVIHALSIIVPKLERANFAFEILNGLMSHHSKTGYFDQYISENRSAVVKIFKRLHSPKEFVDIQLLEGQVKLVCENGDTRSINEVSTGQRTALALSLFLSLNAKLSNGPNIILMDDPVTYVDDLNVLSFFDYLRELIRRGNRQLFFATANSDIAFLFQKKFEFLNDDFKMLKLTR
jgi:exonuclease SbcC